MVNTVAERAAPKREIGVVDQTVGVLENGCFENMLPTCYRGSASRWIQRGKLYINTSKQKDKILKCTMASLVRAFLQGAEQGIPVDGKLGYIVPYGDQATFMASYIGLIAVARRHGLIVDGFARVVRERDEFSLSMEDGVFSTAFRPHIGSDAGPIVGGFAVLIFPGNRTVADFMGTDEIEAIRGRSKAGQSGPWVTDWAEMAKKTVLRRTIKTYIDDPEILALLDADDSQHGILDVEASETDSTKSYGAQKAAPLRIQQSPPPQVRDESPEIRDDQQPELTTAQQLDALFADCPSKKSCDDRRDLIITDPDLPGSELDLHAACDRRKAQCAK